MDYVYGVFGALCVGARRRVTVMGVCSMQFWSVRAYFTCVEAEEVNLRTAGAF